jgi:hypothetical protein
VSKDRAAPFSRKHRRYWIPVTGGMLLIGAVNVALGLSSYKKPEDPVRISVTGDAGLDAAGTLGASELPADVMRAFAVKYPHTLPTGATRDGDRFVIGFPAGAPHKHATFAADGSFVSED